VHKLRVVLDNTVYYSAVGLHGAGASKVLDAWHAEQFELLTSEAILQEVERVLRTKAAYETGIALILATLRRWAILVTSTEVITACRDADDNKILAAAVAGRADYIVTDDKDLRVLSPFRGIEIITVNRFLRRLGIRRRKP